MLEAINFNYLLCGIVILIGIFGVLTKRNLVKLVIALSIIDTGVNMFIISLGYRIFADKASTAPILGEGATIANMVDPIPQALTLTAIVIGACVTALALSLVVSFHSKGGKFEVDFRSD
ncbi:MAG: NADH-quinone oxidoreductase subunit K [Candidatus Micrarchaeota archaeon]|nr:NADH-quinone oxidoreductase subunit K [Candidatus Micrarchaeota archaeon]